MLTLSRLCILSFCYLFFVCQDIIGYFLEKYLVFLQQGPPVRPEDEWPWVWVTFNTWSIANTPIDCDWYGDYDDHDWVDANAYLVSVNFGTPTHCTKNTNKWVNSQQNSRDWPKGCQNMPKFCVLFAKKCTTAGCGGCDRYYLCANDRLQLHSMWICPCSSSPARKIWIKTRHFVFKRNYTVFRPWTLDLGWESWIHFQG